jgi:hypothetical protein
MADEADRDVPIGSNEPRSQPSGRQYIAELLHELEAVDSELLRGRSRFPAKFELSYAPAQFRSILAVANEASQRWDRLDPELASGIESALMQLLDVVATAEALDPAPEEVMNVKFRGETSEQVKRRLEEIQTFFRDRVEPRVAAPPSATAAAIADKELETARLTKEELERSKKEIAELEARSSQINAELDSRKELIEAARTGAGSAGAQDLAHAYEDQADEHARQWKIWGIALIGTLVVALAGGIVLLGLNPPPEEADTAELVSHLTLDLLIVGLLIYAIRITSLQFSVHRHLAAVASNKAAALKTFSRIVSSGSSAETRDRLAEVLAHHVFVSDSTGFLDVASDQITLPERLVDPIAKRVGGTV